MLLERVGHQALVEQGMRLVIGAPAPFFHDHFDLFAEFLPAQYQIVHAVCFQLHRQRQLRFVQLLEIGGVVIAGEGILAPASGRDAARELAGRNGFRSLEHHMFEHMRDAGHTGTLVHAAGVIPDLLHHRGRSMILLDHHFQSVLQRGLEHLRLRAGSQQQPQKNRIKSHQFHPEPLKYPRIMRHFLYCRTRPHV